MSDGELMRHLRENARRQRDGVRVSVVLVTLSLILSLTAFGLALVGVAR